MRWCGGCSDELPREQRGKPDHFFCGYGFAVQYHAKCCPIIVDGTVCQDEHPPDNPNLRIILPEQVDSEECPYKIETPIQEEPRARGIKIIRVKTSFIICKECGYAGFPQRGVDFYQDTGQVICPKCSGGTEMYVDEHLRGAKPPKQD